MLTDAEKVQEIEAILQQKTWKGRRDLEQLVTQIGTVLGMTITRRWR